MWGFLILHESLCTYAGTAKCGSDHTLFRAKMLCFFAQARVILAVRTKKYLDSDPESGSECDS